MTLDTCPTAATSASAQHQLLSPNEAAVHLRISASTLSKWRIAGIGPTHIKLGPRKVFYVRQELDTWIASNRRHSTSEA